jgi:YD repeat-containing protein
MTSFAYTQTSGNGVYINWYLSAWAPTQITDSDNRQVNINYSDSTCGGCTSISYLGAGGSTQVIRVITTSLANALRSGSSAQTIDVLFPGTTQPTSSNYNPTVASKVQLPDGSFYTFLYNSYGELARVVLRTGGAIEFDYGDANNNVNDGGGATGDGFVGNITDGNPLMIYRRLLARREYANGSTLSSTTTFAAASTGSGASEITTETDTVTDPVLGVLAQTKHWYNGIPTDALNVGGTGCNAWNEGFEYETFYGSPSVLRSVANTLATQSGCFNNPKLQSVATTNDAGQVSSVSFAYDQYNNVTDRKEFDWGGVTLLRETQNSYVTTPAYTALNLVRLPSETKVLNGAGVLSSDTTYQYDQGNMANCANIIGHDNANYAGQGTRGNATTVSQFLNSTSAWLNTTLAYDIAGNLVVITDANGRASSLSYVDAYPTAAVNSYAHVTTLTNALNQAQTWT